MDTPEANVPLGITVTAAATETFAWRTLARQAVPMLQRPEQFHISQRQQLAQNICLLLCGDLELEDVFGDAEENTEEDSHENTADGRGMGDTWKEPSECE